MELNQKDSIQHFKDHFEKMAKEAEEREAREKAEFEALPEEEKQRILALREQEKIAEQKRIADQEREEQIRKWKNRGIPPRFYDETWDTWIANAPERKEVKEKIRQAWKKNLLIIGANGTGKTHLAMCLVKEGATYCKAAKLFRTIRDDMSLEQEYIDEYGSCKLLIIDESGRQKGTDFEKNLLFEIIDERWNNMLPTTIIGNISKREFADLYGQASIDRLRPETVELNWESRRTKLNQE